MKFSSVPAYSFGKSKSQEKIGNIPGPADYKGKWNKLSVKKIAPRVPFNRALEERSYPINKRKNQIYEHILENSESTNKSKRNSNIRGMKKGIYKDYSQIKLGDSYYNYRVGPGSYDIYKSTLSRKGSAVIPKALSKTTGKNKRIPGPGQYLGQRSTLEKKGGVNPTAKTGRLSYDKEIMSKPGPADYNYNYSSFTKKGVARLKPPSREGSKSSIPGPGDYDVYPKSSLDKGVPIPRIGRKAEVSETPGPGHYNIYGNKKSKGVKIPRARSTEKLDHTPGPGDYNIDYSTFGDNKGASKIGDSKRWLNIQEYPGPADYDNRVNSKRKGVIFNRSIRWKKNKGHKVGPGSYNLKRSVPDVAKYLLPQVG